MPDVFRAWLIVALLGVGGLVLLLLGIYGAFKLTRPGRSSLDEEPDMAGLPPPEHVRLAARDGLELAAWWFARPDARGSIIICHGHGSHKLQNLWLAAELFSTFNVMLLDVRGHGESAGTWTSVGYLERLDVLGGVDWIHARLGQLPIGVWGLSMGGGAVIQAAADCPRIGAVVADSPFARLRGPVQSAICARGYPRALAPALAWSVCTMARWLDAPRGRPWRDPIDVVDQIAPRALLLIHGEADTLITVDHAYALYQRAGEPKELWVVPEVGHGRVAEVDTATYVERVRRFFEASLEAAGQPATEARADHRHHVGERELDQVNRR